MNFSAWAIRQPIPSILLFIILGLGGLQAFRSLQVQDMPDIALPVVIVTITLPGASPSQLETEVTRKVEDSIASIGEVKHITSNVTDGSSTTYIEFALEKPVDQAVDDVRDAVSRVRSDLPSDIREPIVSRMTSSGGAIVTYAVTSPRMNETELSWFVDDRVKKRLLAVPGVAKVNRVGGVAREVRVELDPDRLTALGATAADVSRQLRLTQREVPGGRGDVGGAEQSVRTVGTAGSVADIAAMNIALADGRRIRLDSVARVFDGHADRTQVALLDGVPVVGFEVLRSRGASEITVAEGVAQALAAMAAEHPDAGFRRISTIVDRVQRSYESSMNMLYEGSILAVIVVWLFLRDWRATGVSALALPLSIIPTFGAMALLGYTLNGVTLLSLALVVGILVDDAIVEVENIVRHLRMGKPPLQAARDAADEIGLAVVATTFTLVAVFLPTAFMGGIPGKYFKQFGWTAAIAVMMSLVVARLLTPMMSAYWLKAHPEPKRESRLGRAYLRVARLAIEHRGITMAASIAFFVGSMALVPLLPKGFLPADELDQVVASVELAPGATLAQTREVAEAARALVADVPEIAGVFAAIGSGRSGDAFVQGTGGDVRKATLTFDLKPRAERARGQKQVEAAVRERLAGLPGVRTSFGVGGPGEKLELVLTSDDPKALVEAARAVERGMRDIPGLGNVTSSATLLRPEIRIQPDDARAADLGVTSSAIGETARIATSGDYDANLAKFNLPDRQLPIRVQFDPAARADLDAVRALLVPGRGGNVRLGNVASVQIDSGPAQIDRYDRSRNVKIEAELGGAPLGEFQPAVDALPALAKLPPGVKRLDAGDAERMNELFGSFGLAMAAGVFCVYAILVLLFKDFLQPVTILTALPLSIGGAFGAVLVTGHSFSMPVLIGLLMLMGIATKNSILLVEYALMARAQLGMSRIDALMDACAKRAQPIVMTTIAMGAGMLPIALGIGADSAFRAPMAVSVIGGLVTSTLLSLIVVPAVFTYIDDLGAWWRRLRAPRPAVVAPAG
jgi:multidrug efflux pump subunit AcrB